MGAAVGELIDLDRQVNRLGAWVEKKVAKKDNGKVELAFIIGTHYHYDHIGAFKAIIEDSDIVIGKAYFKPFETEIKSVGYGGIII